VERFEVMDAGDLPVEKQMEVMFKATDLISDFAEKVVVPVLKGVMNPSRREEAITRTYFRMYLWLDCLGRLNKLSDFQAVNAAARTIFELALDTLLLANDSKGNRIGQFYAFNDVERFRSARNAVEFFKAKSGTVPPEHIYLKELLERPNEETRVLNLRRKHWGVVKKGKKKGQPIQPAHWTGKDAKGRAHELDGLLGTDYERMYVEDYARFSWHIHSGLIGFANTLTPEYYMAVFGTAHAALKTMFRDATRACMNATKIDKTIPDWEAQLATRELDIIETACRECEKESGESVDDDSDGAE
jgi:hypothetical protein